MYNEISQFHHFGPRAFETYHQKTYDVLIRTDLLFIQFHWVSLWAAAEIFNVAKKEFFLTTAVSKPVYYSSNGEFYAKTIIIVIFLQL